MVVAVGVVDGVVIGVDGVVDGVVVGVDVVVAIAPVALVVVAGGGGLLLILLLILLKGMLVEGEGNGGGRGECYYLIDHHLLRVLLLRVEKHSQTFLSRNDLLYLYDTRKTQKKNSHSQGFLETL